MTESELQKLEELSLLASSEEDLEALTAEVTAVMDFVDELRHMQTNVSPLFHPSDMEQRLREDEVLSENCAQQLEDLAPAFADGLYLVPKIID